MTRPLTPSAVAAVVVSLMLPASQASPSAGSYYHTTIEGASQVVADLLATCKADDRWDDSDFADTDLTIKVRLAETDDDEVADLMRSVLASPYAPTFWGRFDEAAEGLEITDENTFLLYNIHDLGKTANMTFTRYVYDEDAMCLRTKITSTSDEFPVPAMAVEAHYSVVTVKEGEFYYQYTTKYNCHAPDVAGATTDQLQEAEDIFCNRLYNRRAMHDTDVDTNCVPALINGSGVLGLLDCLEQARSDEEEF